MELTLETQVSNTMNTVGISSNDKYLLLLIGNVGYGNLQPSFLFCKKQYLSNWCASCCEISHKHCK